VAIIENYGKYLAVMPTCGFTCLTCEDNVWRFARTRHVTYDHILNQFDLPGDGYYCYSSGRFTSGY